MHAVRKRICTVAVGGVIAVAVVQVPPAGNSAPYVIGGGGILGSLAVGAGLTRRRPWAGPAAAAAIPVAALPVQGSLETGLLPYANATGALAALACAAAVLFAQRTAGRTRALGVAWAAAMGVLPWVYSARTAAAGIVLVGLVGAFVRRRRLARPLAKVFLAAVVSTVGLTVWLGTTYTEGGRTALGVRAADATLGQLRQQAWADALALVRSEPLQGVGPGRYAHTAPSAAQHADARWAHSAYLHTAAELGLPAAALVALAVGALLWPPGRVPDASPVVVVAIGVLAINAAIDYVLHFPSVLIAAGLLAGSGAVSSDARVHGHGTADAEALLPSRWTRPVAAALGAWVLLAAPIPFLNPPFRHATDVRLGPEGATFAGTGTLRTSTFPEEVYRRLRSGEGLTIEGWFAPATAEQAGPARIISSSRGIDHRNFTLGQQHDALVLRLRTTETGWNGTDRELVVKDVFGGGRLHHIAVAYDGATVRVHVDGETVKEASGPGGTFDNWVFTYPLLVGNETTGDRPWRGRVVRFALYEHALSSAAIRELADAVRAPDGVPAVAEEIGENLVVAYDLRTDAGPVPATGADVPLVRREAVPIDPPGFMANLWNWEGERSARAPTFARCLVTAAAFAAAARIMVRTLAPPKRAGALVVGSVALLIAGTALFARSASGGDISVVVLGSAVAGAGIGGWRWRPRHHPAAPVDP